MSLRPHYVEGKIYHLAEIRPIAPALEMLIHHSNHWGVMLISKEAGTDFHWLSGPFEGRDSNLFLYLGVQKSRSQLLKVVCEQAKYKIEDYLESQDPTHDAYDGLDGLLDLFSDD